MEDTITTRFMIISDTHSVEFDRVKKCDGTFYPPFPKADVLLHCGDLTGSGGIEELYGAVEMMGELEAELKLVIAGNHDLNLDPQFWKTHMRRGFTKERHEKALQIMTGPSAKAAGITYLEEGLNTFKLKNGAKFTIYTSPHTPEFCDWGFPYQQNQDRFSTPNQVNDQEASNTSVAVNPIPDRGIVDIVMTHGPPQYVLDECADGNVGCDHLLQAISRCRPRLHCFGHIHEGHGAEKITWKGEGDKTINIRKNAMERERVQVVNKYPDVADPSSCHVEFGRETLMVNAAIMNVRYKPTNKPWLLDLDMPRAG